MNLPICNITEEHASNAILSILNPNVFGIISVADNYASGEENIRTRNCLQKEIAQSGFGIFKIIRNRDQEISVPGVNSSLGLESWLLVSNTADNGKLNGFLKAVIKRHDLDLVFYKDRTALFLCSEHESMVFLDLGKFSGLIQIASYFSLLHQGSEAPKEYTEKIEFRSAKSFFSRYENTICSFTYKAQK